MAERDILARALMALSSGPIRLFRQNTGVGWAGSVTHRQGRTITIANARPLTAGLCVGSSDTIGWVSVKVTPEMVGNQVAVFTAIEFKERTKATEEQTRFIDAVRKAGGIAGIAHSTEEARQVIQGCLTFIGHGGTIPPQ